MKVQKRGKREDNEKERAAECGVVLEANFVSLSCVLRADFDGNMIRSTTPQSLSKDSTVFTTYIFKRK